VCARDRQILYVRERERDGEMVCDRGKEVDEIVGQRSHTETAMR
jgi:hypothetical protein